MLDGFTVECKNDPVNCANLQGVKLGSYPTCHNALGLRHGWCPSLDTATGELHYVYTIRGSVHKHKNGGIHNADRFNMSDYKAVLCDFREHYGINTAIARVYTLEFGVNLRLPYSPKRVLKALKSYKTKQFEPLGDIGLQCKTNLFTLKIYDKSKQLEQFRHDNILRIEMRVKGDFLKRHCAFMKRKANKECYLDDLVSVEAWNEFEAFLLDTIENTAIVESIPTDGLKKKDRELIELFTGDGWRLLSRYQLCRKKKRFIELSKELGALSLKDEIKRMISAECVILREDKVNMSNKQEEKQSEKPATKSRYTIEKIPRKYEGEISRKMMGDFVAVLPPLPAHPPNTDLDCLECAEIIGHTRIRGKPHLKPSDQDTS